MYINGTFSETNADPLERYTEAQQRMYPIALKEIRAGRKRSHWMWFIFPQLCGLAQSHRSSYYGIRDLEEAKQYMEHPLLGPRLIEICSALLELESCDPVYVMGFTDSIKLRSCVTLFAQLPDAHPVFNSVLEKYYGSAPDPLTLRLLTSESETNHEPKG